MPKRTRSLGRSQTKFEIGWRFFYFTYVSLHMSFRISLRFPGVVVCVFVLLCFTVFVCVCIGLCVRVVGCMCMCVCSCECVCSNIGWSIPTPSVSTNIHQIDRQPNNQTSLRLSTENEEYGKQSEGGENVSYSFVLYSD